MRELSSEIKVGAVVIAALIILLYGVIWVKEYRFNVEHYTYSVLFPQVGRLEVGDPVSVLGVNKGEVQQIELAGDNKVLVTFSLATGVVLKTDAKFVVMNVGLMGERFVAIWPGEAPEKLDLTQAASGRYDTGIPEVMGMMGEAIEDVRQLVAQLEGTVGEEGKAQQIRETIDELHSLVIRTNNFFRQNEKAMAAAVEDFSGAANQMSGFIERNSADMQEAVGNFADASAKLEEISGDLEVIIGKIREGEGTLGKAVKEDSLYVELRSTINSLDSLITDFKKNPKKYIHFSVF